MITIFLIKGKIKCNISLSDRVKLEMAVKMRYSIGDERDYYFECNDTENMIIKYDHLFIDIREIVAITTGE